MVMTMLIVQICGGLSHLDYQACAKALEATSVQCSIKQDFDHAEKVTMDMAYTKVSIVTGTFLIGTAGVALKTYRDKSLSYPILKKSDGFVPSIMPSANPHGGKLQFKWDF